jgi:ribosomal protein S18 acetylase RimI-like enzyme
MIQIQEIDFDKEIHKSYVLKLCKRNNYYIEDCCLQFNKLLLNMVRNEIQKNNILKGYFAILNNKVIGFSICDCNSRKTFWDLMFLLIDKKYQGQKYGTTLINHIINDFEKHNGDMIKLKCYDNENKWYKTFGFQNNLRILKNEYNYLILFNAKKEGPNHIKKMFDYVDNLEKSYDEKKVLIDSMFNLFSL